MYVTADFHEYDAVNRTVKLESEVKVYNSKQMEDVIKTLNGVSNVLDWKENEESKKYYMYKDWWDNLPNMLETTILRDTDGDKIPDIDDEDDDNDGLSDAQEIIDGTNPKDASSFKVTKICYKVKG